MLYQAGYKIGVKKKVLLKVWELQRFLPSFRPCSHAVSALFQFTFRYVEMVVAAADIKNHSYFIIIFLSADSLLVDVYIFFMGTPCNVS